MNIILRIIIDGAVGWLTYYALRFNVTRGLAVSLIIGIAGTVLGGDVPGPVLVTVAPGDLNPIAFFMAFASAAGCLIIRNMIYRRLDVSPCA